MKKVITLTESDIRRMVLETISEMGQITHSSENSNTYVAPLSELPNAAEEIYELLGERIDGTKYDMYVQSEDSLMNAIEDMCERIEITYDNEFEESDRYPMVDSFDYDETEIRQVVMDSQIPFEFKKDLCDTIISYIENNAQDGFPQDNYEDELGRFDGFEMPDDNF